MRLLVDTNVFLEGVLGQAKAELVKDFLALPDNHDLFISDFSLHSVGVLLFRNKDYQVFQEFVSDMILNTGIQVIALMADDVDTIIDTAWKFNLDFDDAYQYTAAEKYDLTLISFDHDFDRTPRGRQTPEAILKTRP